MGSQVSISPQLGRLGAQAATVVAGEVKTTKVPKTTHKHPQAD